MKNGHLPRQARDKLINAGKNNFAACHVARSFCLPIAYFDAIGREEEAAELVKGVRGCWLPTNPHYNAADSGAKNGWILKRRYPSVCPEPVLTKSNDDRS